MPRHCLILLLLFCIYSSNALAQKGVGKIVFTADGVEEKCKVPVKTGDSLSIRLSFRRCLTDIQKQGYLEARIDSIHYGSKPPIGFGQRGNKYRWGAISTDSITQSWLANTGVNPGRISGSTLSPLQFAALNNRILHWHENNGYPFAKIRYDNAQRDNSLLSIVLNIEKGQLIVLDTLYIKGDAKISYRFLKTFLGFRKGQPYSEAIFSSYDTRMQSLGYLSIIRPSEVEFIPGKARIYTYVTNRKSNRFSFLLGFQSDGKGMSGIRLTGDLHLDLRNTFRNGERNSIKWQAPGERTQRLDMQTQWPYILGSNLGISGRFNLYRRDKTYISINPEMMLDFYFANGSSLGIGFEHRKSSAIASAAHSVYGDFNANFYRLSFSTGMLSDDIFHSKYFWAKTAMSVGVRNADSRMAAYGREKISVGEAEGAISFFYPIYGEFAVFHSRLQARWLFPMVDGNNDFRFLDNELYRIGGSQVLRGFNQESILTNGYSVAEIEVQYRLQQTINTSLFYDLGLVSHYSNGQIVTSFPFGVGVGVQLLTAGGILNISYALGEGFGQRLSLKDAKIHVGYLTHF